VVPEPSRQRARLQIAQHVLLVPPRRVVRAQLFAAVLWCVVRRRRGVGVSVGECGVNVNEVGLADGSVARGLHSFTSQLNLSRA